MLLWTPGQGFLDTFGFDPADIDTFDSMPEDATFKRDVQIDEWTDDKGYHKHVVGILKLCDPTSDAGPNACPRGKADHSGDASELDGMLGAPSALPPPTKHRQ